MLILKRYTFFSWKIHFQTTCNLAIMLESITDMFLTGITIILVIIISTIIYEVRVRFRTRVRVQWDSMIKKLLKIFLFLFSIYFYY